jgi:hypothetical protein
MVLKILGVNHVKRFVMLSHSKIYYIAKGECSMPSSGASLYKRGMGGYRDGYIYVYSNDDVGFFHDTGQINNE